MKYDLEKLLKENMNIQETPSQELQEKILYQEEEGISMRDNKKMIKFVPKAAAAALAVILATGGIAYAGTHLWNHYAADRFGVGKNEALKKELNEKGFAEQPQEKESKNNQVSVTDKDITVTLQQTLADEHSAYVCFEVKYGDQYHVVDEGVTEETEFGVARPAWTDFGVDYGEDINSELSYGGGGKKIIDDHTILYDYFLNTSENTFKDGRIKMSISAFQMDQEEGDPKTIVEDGKWDLAWDLSVGTEKRVYHLDQMLTLGENKVTLKDLTITPLSTKLTMENPDGVPLSKIGAVVKDTGDKPHVMDENGNLEVIRYVAASGEEEMDKVMKKLPKGEVFYPLDLYYLCLDGEDFDGVGGGISTTADDYLDEQFDKVLDLEKVTGARIGGQYIDLTDVSYDTKE